MGFDRTVNKKCLGKSTVSEQTEHRGKGRCLGKIRCKIGGIIIIDKSIITFL